MTLSRVLAGLAATALLVTPATAQPAPEFQPSPENVRAHVTFLASDLLQGREAGSPGYDIAAAYVASQFAQLGLKPAGKIEPPIAAADRSLETGHLKEVANLISTRMEKGLHGHFEDVMKKKKYDPKDVAAGRAFASAYVEYTHYVERLYEAGETLAPGRVQKEAPGLAHSH